jgi:hypothetical protein
MKKVAAWGGAGLVLGNVLLATVVFAIVLTLGGTAEIAWAVAGILALMVGVIAAIAYKLFPGAPLRRTRERIQNDMNQLREHVA